jgi:hypothetical protein
MELFETRDEMVKTLLCPGSRIAEIGVFEGTFSDVLLSTKPSRLWLIDPWDGISCSGDADGNNVRSVNLETVYYQLLQKYHDNPNVKLVRGRSPWALSSLETWFDNCPTPSDGWVDAVYIDGDHSYEGCLADLLTAERYVRAGGWIMGHDYSMNMSKAKNHYEFGVKQAVDEFCERRKLKLSAVAMDGCMSYAIKVPEAPPSGLN